MDAEDLPRSSPSAQGVDPAGVLSFVDALESLPGVEPHSLMLLRHGTVVAEGWWAPYTPDRTHLLYSLSKSFTSTALGFAVAEGLVSLDDRLIDHFQELDAVVTDERSRRMLVRHIAAMASGHRAETWDDVVASDPDEPVRGFLQLPPDEEPGTVFAYNQPCTYTLAAIIARACGATLTDYLRPRLFEPLGISDHGWLRDPNGRELGFSGLHARTDAVARLGQLYLQKGRWAGRQLLDERWVAEATHAHSKPTDREPDWVQGYGFQFWMARHGYRGDGAYGQFCIVLPEHDVVLAMTGGSEDMQAVLDAAWQHLLPAFGTPGSAASSDADAALLERLRHLELAGPGGAAQPPQPADWAGAITVDGIERLATVELDHDADGWSVALVEVDGGRVDTIRIGGDSWTLSDAPVSVGGTVPVAARGGWSGDELAVDLLFVETPHRLRLRATTSGATAEWATTPLHRFPPDNGTPLHTLRTPRA